MAESNIRVLDAARRLAQRAGEAGRCVLCGSAVLPPHDVLVVGHDEGRLILSGPICEECFQSLLRKLVLVGAPEGKD